MGKLLQKGIHPTTISESFQKAAGKAVDILTGMATPLDLTDRESLLKASNTSLNSKVVSQNSAELSPIAVDAVLKIIDPAKENNVNLKDIKIIINWEAQSMTLSWLMEWCLNRRPLMSMVQRRLRKPRLVSSSSACHHPRPTWTTRSLSLIMPPWTEF